jgi:hypothetical protein
MKCADDKASVDVEIPAECQEVHNVIMYWVAEQNLFATVDDEGYTFWIVPHIDTDNMWESIGGVDMALDYEPGEEKRYHIVIYADYVTNFPNIPIRQYLTCDYVRTYVYGKNSRIQRCMMCGIDIINTRSSHYDKCLICDRNKLLFRQTSAIAHIWMLMGHMYNFPQIIVWYTAYFIDRLGFRDMVLLPYFFEPQMTRNLLIPGANVITIIESVCGECDRAAT